MRESYQQELSSVVTDLITMTDRVQVAVTEATKALLTSDLAAAEKIAVIEAESYIRERGSRADDSAFLEAVSHIPATPVTEAWDMKPEQQ